MLIGLIVLAVVSSWQASGTQEPLRVVPGAESETKKIYRPLKAGEQRVDALLRRIECPAGRPVTFMLQVKDETTKKDKPLKFTAPTLGSVDYVAHTPTFRGPVSCGGRTPPDHVYLTWKNVNGAPRVVSVEFLPPK